VNVKPLSFGGSRVSSSRSLKSENSPRQVSKAARRRAQDCPVKFRQFGEEEKVGSWEGSAHLVKRLPSKSDSEYSRQRLSLQQ